MTELDKVNWRTLTWEALTIAAKAHAGQVDKAGEPYILHPIAVARRYAYAGPACCIALLHDVLEDSDYTAVDLNAAGFPSYVVDAVVALTHLENEPRHEYYARVKANIWAREVKMEDIRHNSAPERLALLDEETRERLMKKYADALAALGGKDESSYR